jgi:hypothetical protein
MMKLQEEVGEGGKRGRTRDRNAWLAYPPTPRKISAGAEGEGLQFAWKALSERFFTGFLNG